MGFYGPKTTILALLTLWVDAFDRVVIAFNNNVIVHYARVLLINLMHVKFPRLVVLIELTCNRDGATTIR